MNKAIFERIKNLAFEIARISANQSDVEDRIMFILFSSSYYYLVQYFIITMTYIFFFISHVVKGAG
jgi:hypothetical protein